MANWYFGFNGGLDFNTGNARSLNNSGINTVEASSAISSANGNLLFYSDGQKIFNRQFDVMPNGEDILGHVSSTTGVVIIPDPGNMNRYYVFTADAVQHYQEGPIPNTGEGFNYSIVDLSLNGGFGDVTLKNVNLIPESSEKLTVVARGDNLGFWVLTHAIDSFYAYSVTAAGISEPIITTIGPVVDNFNNIRGWIKLSPDGSKLGVAHTLFEPSLDGLLYLYDFDDMSGVVSNETLLADDLVYYGVEFSSNSERMYASGKLLVSAGLLTGNIQLFQYDLIATDVASTRFLIEEIENDALSDIAGALQIGIDCKIYFSNTDNQTSVIARPNRDNEAADFRFEEVDLGTGVGSLGLPACIQSFFDSIIEYDNLCLGDTVQFALNTSRAIDSVIWNFDDPTSPDNTSTAIDPIHVYSTFNTYLVSAQVVYSDGEVRTYEKLLEVVDLPSLDSVTLRQCDTDGSDDGMSIFNLEKSIPLILSNELIDNTRVTFFETENDALLDVNEIADSNFYPNTFSGQVIYARAAISIDCLVIVSVELMVQANSMPPDREGDICDIVGSEQDVNLVLDDILLELAIDFPDLDIVLYPNLESAVLETNDLFLNPISTITNVSGIYYRVENEAGCLAIGFYGFNVFPAPEVFNFTEILCNTNDGLVLSLDEEFAAYEWDTGETTSSITVFEAGNYQLTVFNPAGCMAVSLFTVEAVPQADVEIVVNDFQQNNSIIVTSTDPAAELFYSIDGGLTYQQNGVFNDLPSDKYQLVVIDLEGCNEIRELIEVRGAPRYFTPNGDGVHDFWHINDVESYPGMTVQVMDRFGKNLTSLSSTSQGWDGTYGGVNMPTNAYWYRIDYDGQTYMGHFTLIRREI